MSKPLDDSRIDQLIADYLTDSLSETDRPVFEDWLRASPKNPRRVARLSATDYAIREVCQDTKADYLLDVLNQIDEAAGPAQLVTLHQIDSSQHRYRVPATIGGAVAAVLMIALTLIITLQGPAPAPSSIADATTSNKPAEMMPPGPIDPALRPTVATLTAEHNAVWDQKPDGGHRPGDQLAAGQRLTLTQGFAEITTNDGAIAILEAPATIELLDHNNALRLHTGKLVGICETESSKGFLVRTAHMDITDLGTRFGVDATFTSTEVHVFQGEVRAALLSNHAEASLVQQLTAGQAVVSTNSKMTLANLETGSFVPALNFASGLADLCPRFEGDPVIWRGELAQDMDLRVHESDKTQLMLEHRGLRLDAGVPVDLLPGEVWPHERGFGKALAHAGSKVDVYLLHFDPVGSKSSLDIETTSVLRFDRPIVGLIGAQSTLHSTDSHLGLPGVTYPRPINVPASPPGGPAGLDLEPNLDVVKVSEDGLTLTLKLQTGHLTDQIRILVQANLNPPLEKP